jgi:hypothetical protein
MMAEEPFTVSTHKGPVRLSPGVIDDAARTAFHNGHCLALARALAEQTGWPVVAHLSRPGDLMFERGMDGSTIAADLPTEVWADAFVHALVETPDGMLLDIDGLHDPDEYRQSAYDSYGTVAIAYVEPDLLERALDDAHGQRFDEPGLAGSFAAALLEPITN